MDIIFFAAVAIFIFFKLREQLGKVDEDKKRESIRQFLKEQANLKNSQSNIKANIIQSPGSKNIIIAVPAEALMKDANKSLIIDEKSQKILDELDGKVRVDLKNTLFKANVSIVDFLNGATKAFEMILNSFAVADLAILKSLLSEKLFLQFENAIKDRQNQGQVLNTQIIAVDKAKIVLAQILDNYAAVTIQFTSRQINYIANANGEIVFGSKEEINIVNDVWTFKKDCNSSNPNWFVSTTS